MCLCVFVYACVCLCMLADVCGKLWMVVGGCV